MDGNGGDDVITEKVMSASCSPGMNEKRTFIVLRRDIDDEARLSIRVSRVNAGEPHEEAALAHTFDSRRQTFLAESCFRRDVRCI